MPPSRLEIRGGVCMVTGAGGGIGLATVRELVARGARGLVLVGHREDELDAWAAGLNTPAMSVQADVTDSAAMADAVAATLERFGALDIVVANAGIERVGTLRTQAAEDFERVIEVNLLGVYRTLRPAIEPIIESRGHLLAVSSLAAMTAFPLAAAYGASKAGVDSLMRGLRAELLHTGASAGTAYFGYIDTQMMVRARAHPAIEHVLRRLPARMRRPSTPEEAARAIADGIERRRARVCLPRIIGTILMTRGFLHLMDDRVARRLDVAGAVRMAEAEARQRQLAAR